jgi:hypothetical protein
LVIPEPAETEMASVLEEVTTDYTVTEVAQVALSDADTVFDVPFAVCEAVTVFHAITFAVLETIMVFAFIAVVQFAVVALREAIKISAVVCVHVCRRSVINASCRAVISHTRSARAARAALGTKARARSTAAARTCTTAKAWSTATTSMRSNAATTSMRSNAATAAAATTTTVMALRVSAAREDERQGRCDYEFPHWLTSFIC